MTDDETARAVVIVASILTLFYLLIVFGIAVIWACYFQDNTSYTTSSSSSSPAPASSSSSSQPA